MNDCMNADVRDALPALLHGRLDASDSAAILAHLETCAVCRAEFELLKSVRAAAPLAPAIDATRIAAAIKPYSHTQTGALRPSGVRRMGAFRWAAAAALVAGAGWMASDFSSVESRVAPAPSSVALTPGETPASVPADTRVPQPIVSESVSTHQPVRVASLSLVGGTQDLSDDDLESLVAELDGIDAMPSAEPQSLTGNIESLVGGGQ